MINLRGRTLPVVDLSSRLGRRLEPGSKTRILVVEASNGSLGLIVDAVGERLIMLIDAERALGSVPSRRSTATRPLHRGGRGCP